MVFSSLTFLYFFLPPVILLYFLSKNRAYRNTVLLIFSLIFYSWGEPKLLLMMLMASLTAYIAGLLMQRFEDEGRQRAKKAVFITSVCILSGNLFVFKYLNFACDNISRFFGIDMNIAAIALPIGISFYTFQILSYVIDLYKKEVGVQRNYFYLTLYVAFFPQLIAGPIVRYETIEAEIHDRKETFYDFAEGLKRFITGLFKKAVIANSVSILPTIVYSGEGNFGSGMYWLAAISYALQIYFDFSGYSDMAIGIGRMFGFHFLENFNYPYTATSITDFWRRWHISLSSWFRDYIYIPLGGNRVKKQRFVFNILFVWTVTGLWHGADWNFILWGFYYGVLLLGEKMIWGKFTEKLPSLLRWAYSMFFVLIGWVIFNLTDMSVMADTLKTMFSFAKTDMSAAIAANTDILLSAVYIPLGLLCMLPWKNWVKVPKNECIGVISYVVHVGLFFVSVVYIISSSYNPFIYFRF